jgi:hypothetical protein
VEESANVVEAEKVEPATLNGKPAVRIHFSGPVSPLSLDHVRAVRADGSEVPVARWVGVNLQDLFLTSQDGLVLDTKSVVIEGVEDRTGRAVSSSQLPAR